MARPVRVVAVSMARGLRRAQCRQDNYDYIASVFEDAAPLHPDLVVLPEVFAVSDLPERMWLPGPDAEFVCGLARKYGVNVAGCIFDWRADGCYNTTLLVGRDGAVVGRYDKVHQTEPALARGGRCGAADHEPVAMDIGRVGVRTCFDANWPEEWGRLAAQGAEIILFPSAYPGGRVLESLALLYHVPIVASVQMMPAGILDGAGRWLARTDRFSWWVSATLDLERTVFHWDFQGEKLRAVRAKYGARVRIETFGEEAWFALEPAAPDVSIPEIAREFGLVTHREYMARVERVCARGAGV